MSNPKRPTPRIIVDGRGGDALDLSACMIGPAPPPDSQSLACFKTRIVSSRPPRAFDVKSPVLDAAVDYSVTAKPGYAAAEMPTFRAWLQLLVNQCY
jgi:hypothetical protein